MQKNSWKALAIIFFALLVLENILLFIAYREVIDEENKTKECYYDICEDYIDATYQDGVCFCYDTDMLGNLKIAKTEVIK